MPDLINVAFASRPTARLNSGLASALPAAPTGFGDSYQATDTAILYLTSDGAAWDIQLPLPGIQDIGARVRLSAAQEDVVPDTDTAISWSVEDYDTNGFWAVSPNPTRIVFPNDDKKYRFDVCITFAAATDDETRAYLRLNGTTLLAGQTSFGTAVSGVAQILSFSYENVRQDTDYVEVMVRHGDASNADIATLGTFLVVRQMN